MPVAWAGRADGYAAGATPLTSIRAWKAWVRAARCWAAGIWGQRSRNEIVGPMVLSSHQATPPDDPADHMHLFCQLWRDRLRLVGFVVAD